VEVKYEFIKPIGAGLFRHYGLLKIPKGSKFLRTQKIGDTVYLIFDVTEQEVETRHFTSTGSKFPDVLNEYKLIDQGNFIWPEHTDYIYELSSIQV
jgi:hypothetical protein